MAEEKPKTLEMRVAELEDKLSKMQAAPAAAGLIACLNCYNCYNCWYCYHCYQCVVDCIQVPTAQSAPLGLRGGFGRFGM